MSSLAADTPLMLYLLAKLLSCTDYVCEQREFCFKTRSWIRQAIDEDCVLSRGKITKSYAATNFVATGMTFSLLDKKRPDPYRQNHWQI
ncbi:hypothetical protein ACIQW9_07930 [Herminiimonas sp. NPDC097707]|uniref:hypothetical protein n=1 Tax=Herminiimonas sp. NPDC097707 TaxID=3364007 RepID=UPI00383BCE1F